MCGTTRFRARLFAINQEQSFSSRRPTCAKTKIKEALLERALSDESEAAEEIGEKKARKGQVY